MAMLLAAPFINILVVRGGPRWLCAYGAVVGGRLAGRALSVALTAALFRPRAEADAARRADRRGRRRRDLRDRLAGRAILSYDDCPISRS